MITKKSLGLLGGLCVVLFACSAFAQGNGTNDCTGTNYYNHNYSYSNHWFYTNSGPWWSDLSRWSNGPGPRVWTNHHQVIGPKGPGPNGPPTPADVQALVQRFQQDRDRFMTQQRLLEQQMADATEQERQRLRDQLRDQLQEWKQQQARMRDQLQEQAVRQRDQLRDHTRLLDRASNPGPAPAPGSGGAGPAAGSGARGR